MRRLPLPLLFVFAIACASSTSTADPTPAVAQTLDGWHHAASVADESAYFGAMAPEFVFLGTDATERWDKDAFREYAHPHFAAGKGWTFTPRDRHIILSPSRDVAWFDEKLDSASYGECRGTGVLRLVGGEWKLTHYNLTIPIPNDLAKEFVARIKGAK